MTSVTPVTTAPADDAAAETDIHHFDELHRLLLRYIQEDKGSLLLLMLSVPTLYEDALFWRTCTYHEGIAAAVLEQLIARRAHAGLADPHLIILPSQTQNEEKEDEQCEGGEQGSGGEAHGVSAAKATTRGRSKSHKAQPHNKSKNSIAIEITEVCEAERPIEDSTGVSLAEVYVLLQRCLAAGSQLSQTNNSNNNKDDGSAGVQERKEEQVKDSVLESFMRALRRGLGAQVQPPQVSEPLSDRTTTNTSTRSKLSSQDRAGNGDAAPRRFDLAALSAVLRERCYNMLYVNPLDPSNRNVVRKAAQPASVRGKENAKRSISPQPVQQSGQQQQSAGAVTNITTTTSSTQHKRQRSSTPPCASLSSPTSSVTAVSSQHAEQKNEPPPQQQQHQVVVAERPAEKQPRTEAAVHTTSSAPSLAEQALGQYGPPVTTALEVLQAVKPVPGTVTRIVSSFDAIASNENENEGGDDNTTDNTGTNTTTTKEARERREGNEQATHKAHREEGAMSPVEEAKAALSHLAQRSQQAPPPPPPTQRQKNVQESTGAEKNKQYTTTTATTGKAKQVDADEARVAAAIRAFDVFNRADETEAGAQGSTNDNNIITSGNNNSGGGGERGALDLRYTHNATGNNTSEDHRQQKGYSHTGSHPGRATEVNSGGHRIVRRRVHFTEAEDAAIVQGVARYGQSPSRFKFIFEAFREVWLPGRTAVKLYDHWRDALRRRTMTECRPGNSESEEGEEEENDA